MQWRARVIGLPFGVFCVMHCKLQPNHEFKRKKTIFTHLYHYNDHTISHKYTHTRIYHTTTRKPIHFFLLIFPLFSSVWFSFFDTSIYSVLCILFFLFHTHTYILPSHVRFVIRFIFSFAIFLSVDLKMCFETSWMQLQKNI